MPIPILILIALLRAQFQTMSIMLLIYLFPPRMSLPAITKFFEGWDTPNKCLRRQIFCLEQVVQVEELLQSKGGANMLVICHSDFEKIRHMQYLLRRILVSISITMMFH
ncbi:hypothetical protein CRYUN_Cryun35bG0071800 [Craigia yunnanensis]